VSELTIRDQNLTGQLLEQYRHGRLPPAMIDAAIGRPLLLPALLEPLEGPSGWNWSRPLRAGATALLPDPVKERGRRDGAAKVSELPLEAPALSPPSNNWPFDLPGLAEEDKQRHFRATADWEELDRDWNTLPADLVLPVAAMRYLVLQNGEAEKGLDLTWPGIAVWLMQLCMDSEARQRSIEMLPKRLGCAKKVVCPEAFCWLAAYQGALWSVNLLNGALGEPYESMDVSQAYDGPFLHAMLRCLVVFKEGDEVEGFELDEKGRVVLNVEGIMKGQDAQVELFKSLLAAWEQSLKHEVDDPFGGKLKKLKFTMPQDKKKKGHHKESFASKPAGGTNSFAALRK